MGMNVGFLLRWTKLYKGTPSEHAIEPAIASLGRVYRFQHPVWSLGVFPDFAMLKDKVIIEVDDPGHNKKKKEDAVRTAKLNKLGWTVVRCTNHEAETDPYGTVDRLMEEANLPYRTHR
jgi:very-short-patch-repair endonuclease